MALAEDRLTARPSGRAADQALRAPRRAGGTMLSGAPTWAWALAAVLILLPLLVSGFVLNSIFSYSFILGMIGLSLMFLGGYGGMVSLTQMTVAGLAAYMTAIFGPSAIETISLGWPWYLTIPTAIVIATAFGTLAGLLAVRTEGIYTIMITLAIAAAFFYFTRQNYVVFNGFSGFNGILPPKLFGVDWQQAVPFYYLTLFWAVVCFLVVLYLSRAPFGLALQGVRDNPRRMAALGYNVIGHRVAAYSFAAILAGIGGILQTWNLAQISPGTAGIG
ncbi:MAG: branched-chain amino acid ABC transporter permease, partial [Pseudomonadota bacterium]